MTIFSAIIVTKPFRLRLALEIGIPACVAVMTIVGCICVLTLGQCIGRKQLAKLEKAEQEYVFKHAIAHIHADSEVAKRSVMLTGNPLIQEIIHLLSMRDS